MRRHERCSRLDSDHPRAVLSAAWDPSAQLLCHSGSLHECTLGDSKGGGYGIQLVVLCSQPPLFLGQPSAVVS